MLYIEKKGGIMSRARIQQIERRIVRIKEDLQTLGPMRPGSLTCQYRDPENRSGAYWQISYTRQMKSRTEYVRREMGRGDSQTDRDAQAIQAPDRPMGCPEHRALTVGHADCKNERLEVGWNPVLTSEPYCG